MSPRMVLSTWEVTELLAERAQGWTDKQIASAHGISRSTVYRYLRRHRANHLCEWAGGCWVRTPRALCYYHARSV